MSLENGIILFFLWLSDIPLYIYSSSSPIKHLDDKSNALAIVSNAAMITEVHTGFHIRVLISSRYMPRSRTADHMVALFLVFEGLSMLFSIVVAHFILQWEVILNPLPTYMRIQLGFISWGCYRINE